MVGALALNLDRSHERGRQVVADALERRTEQTGKLIGSAFTATNTPGAARAKFGGTQQSVRAAVATQAAASGSGGRIMVLDDAGEVMASSPRRLQDDPRLLDLHPHLRRALAGVPSLSDVYTDARGREMVEIAIPFETPSGRRVLAGSGPVAIVETFTATVLPTAASMDGSRVFLLDGNGRTLAATAARPQDRRATPDPRLLAQLADHENGTFADRTYFSAPVGSSNWKVVLSIPRAELYASVDDGPADAAWQLFAAFVAAMLALFGVAITAVRSVRRLATAEAREHAARQLAHARLHDPLTGLPNRSLLMDRADHAIDAARRRGRSVALLFLDVDHFKRINDSVGHEGGDAVLYQVAQRLKAIVRSVDTVSRFGGDEFVVLCEDLDHDDALRLVQIVEHGLDGPVIVDREEVAITCSIGLAIHDGDGDERAAADLLRDADVAMYRAKDAGRGQVVVFDDGYARSL